MLKKEPHPQTQNGGTNMDTHRHQSDIIGHVTAPSDISQSATIEKLSCICGKPLEITGHANGMYNLTCMSKTPCQNYGLPDTSPMLRARMGTSTEGVVVFAGFQPASEISKPQVPVPAVIADIKEKDIKLFNCKSCGAGITHEQAMASYNIHGKAMCQTCEVGA